MAFTASVVESVKGSSSTMHSRFSEWFFAAILMVWWWIFLHRFMQRNSKGPKTWPILGCIPEQAKNFDKLHDWLLKYFHSVSTFSVPMMTINNTFTVDPANVEHILKTRFDNYPKGERLNERFADMMGKGIFTVDGELWRQQRKVAVFEFSSSKLRDYSIHEFREKGLKLVQVLAVAAKNHQVVDLQDLFMRLTLDSICKVGFGVELRCLTPLLPSIPFGTAFDEANRLIVRRYVDMFWKIKRTLNIGREAKLKKCIEVVDSFLYNVIEKRRAELKASQYSANDEAGVDLLSRFMTVQDEHNRPAYTDKQLRDIVVNFIIAGRDTTALTLSWFFSLLCKNPRVVDGILHEISTVLGQIQRDSPVVSCGVKGFQKGERGSVDNRSGEDFEKQVLEFSQLLNYQALNRMHYLQAAITETLRLYPAVPLETKTVASDDVLPDGTEVKEGNFVSYVPYSMGRVQYIWGPDADDFKPERWLKDGVFQPQSPFKFTAFQAGPRMCLGKDSSYLQMKMTTVLLLKFFEFQLVEGHQIGYSMMAVLYMAKGLKTAVSWH
eukprot:c4102_g2_i1 orf=874-2526(+)